MELNKNTQAAAKTNTPRNLGFEATTENIFYFASYNSNDCDRISPYAQQLNQEGIPLWYDKGLTYGEKWEEEIGMRIAASQAFILFFTKGILAKNDSYVIKEFRIAKKQNKPIFILMIDNMENTYWKEYPQKSSFLDDVDQMHSCACSSIEHLIRDLKIHNQVSAPTPKVTPAERVLPFSEPIIVDSETLLNSGYFTARELAQRHVELDCLTIDKNLFPEALDVEGDADTWENMVVDTADCTGNLIVNNKIMGYMDFIPVTPENYDLLKTQPFNDEYVAFYSFGGKFDIFVSMFSIDRNYAVANNYKLFFQWMINRILDLRDNGVYINRIQFSIYSKYQAAALKSLGCKKILENKLKGLLYETRAKDLLNNEVLLSNIIKRRISTYHTYTNSDKDIVEECKKITEPLLAKNGGILQYEDAVNESDIIIVAKLQEKIVGYVCLKNYDVFSDGIYVEQIAVMEKYQGIGIGKQLLQNAISYASTHNYNKMYANCQKHNVVSQSLFTDAGFTQFDMTQEQYLHIGIRQEKIANNYAFEYIVK